LTKISCHPVFNFISAAVTPSFVSEFNQNVSLLSQHTKEAKKIAEEQFLKGIKQESINQGK